MMRTMVCPGLTDVIVREILSQKKKTHTVSSCSNFVRNYYAKSLTHISLPNLKAVEIVKVIEQIKRPSRNYREKIVDYTVFELGAIVERSAEYSMRCNYSGQRNKVLNLTPCRCKADLELIGVNFKKNEICGYKLSNYPLISGDRYLVFFNNNFRAGFSRDEFYNYFSEVKDGDNV